VLDWLTFVFAICVQCGRLAVRHAVDLLLRLQLT
jgi:hypothetical protein